MSIFSDYCVQAFWPLHRPCRACARRPASPPAPASALRPKRQFAGDARARPPAAAPAPATAAPAPPPAAAPAPRPAPRVQGVDVTAILDGLVAKHHEKLDWRHSIVDLLKALDIDSSLSARKELAAELHYTGSTADSGDNEHLADQASDRQACREWREIAA